MYYSKKITKGTLTTILLLALCNPCTASNKDTKNTTLNLTIDTTKTTTFSTNASSNHTFEKPAPIKYGDKVSKKINSAKKVLKKITTFKYGKKQKVKAKITKSTYLLQYTHTL